MIIDTIENLKSEVQLLQLQAEAWNKINNYIEFKNMDGTLNIHDLRKVTRDLRIKINNSDKSQDIDCSNCLYFCPFPFDVPEICNECSNFSNHKFKEE
jgi:predicted aldo/keto reductase-like oxidoreductase